MKKEVRRAPTQTSLIIVQLIARSRLALLSSSLGDCFVDFADEFANRENRGERGQGLETYDEDHFETQTSALTYEQSQTRSMCMLRKPSGPKLEMVQQDIQVCFASEDGGISITIYATDHHC